MGEYCYIINRTKKQYLHPHRFGSGLKPWEVLASGHALRGLGILLMETARIPRKDNPLIGSWIGDDIIIAGDEACSDLYDEASESYEDISGPVRDLLEGNEIDLGRPW